MKYYNPRLQQFLNLVGDEGEITDDNSDTTRSIEVGCCQLASNLNYSTAPHLGDFVEIMHNNKKWFNAVIDKNLEGYTTFINVTPSRAEPLEQTPLIISNSYTYDGETESFDVPIIEPIFANDDIICSISGFSSNKNKLTIKPLDGVVKVERERTP